MFHTLTKSLTFVQFIVKGPEKMRYHIISAENLVHLTKHNFLRSHKLFMSSTTFEWWLHMGQWRGQDEAQDSLVAWTHTGWHEGKGRSLPGQCSGLCWFKNAKVMPCMKPLSGKSMVIWTWGLKDHCDWEETIRLMPWLQSSSLPWKWKTNQPGNKDCDQASSKKETCIYFTDTIIFIRINRKSYECFSKDFS